MVKFSVYLNRHVFVMEYSDQTMYRGAYTQADLNLRCVRMSKGTFSEAGAQVSRDTVFRTRSQVRPLKIQVSLCTRSV